jgi:hypothetical protein
VPAYIGVLIKDTAMLSYLRMESKSCSVPPMPTSSLASTDTLLKAKRLAHFLIYSTATKIHYRVIRMLTRNKTFLWMLVGWLIIETASWALNNWLSTNVTEPNITIALTYLNRALAYLTNGFSIGFILGAALFSAWDWPFAGRWIKKRRELARNKDADESLAQECDQISKELYESAVQFERLRGDNWASSSRLSYEESEQSRQDSRASERREQERVQRVLGSRVQLLLVKLESRGIRMELWNFSIGPYDLAASSYFLTDIAFALREGTYLDKVFKCDRVTMPSFL